MSTLAQELVDHLIDLYRDTDGPIGMQKRGLVSKRWLPRSRYHLFSRVSLHEANLPTFVDLVRTSLLPTLSFIQQLQVHLSRGPPSPPLDRTLLENIHSCPNLTHIEFTDASDSGPLDSYQSLYIHLRSWGHNSASLTDFTWTLDMRKIIPLCDLVDMVSCLASLTTLRISARNSIITADAYIPPPEPSHRLQKVSLQIIDGGEAIFSWLPSLPVLKSLGFYGRLGDVPEAGLMQEYFRRAGSNLESLFLHIAATWAVAKPVYIQIFDYTTQLRDLTFHCSDYADLLEILSRLHASDWCTITVIAHFHTSWQELDAGLLDAALAASRFATLQKFSIKGVSGRTLITKEARCSMPLANARGILGELDERRNFHAV
ncbi:hypothetical protein B0H10DRAFT_2228178 [Mycena sp. CBHHK59/15]|nr:hypothetical protein B0H10DRAFT_2228178 [Mycena sp. CBHHK59/15]